jgi:hypothetical protein
MSNNISGSAGGWVETQKRESITERPSTELSITEELSNLISLRDVLEAKYNLNRNKDLGDALVTLQMTIKSLTN